MALSQALVIQCDTSNTLDMVYRMCYKVMHFHLQPPSTRIHEVYNSPSQHYRASILLVVPCIHHQPGEVHNIPFDFTEASVSISGDRYHYPCSVYYPTPSNFQKILATVSSILFD